MVSSRGSSTASKRGLGILLQDFTSSNIVPVLLDRAAKKLLHAAETSLEDFASQIVREIGHLWRIGCGAKAFTFFESKCAPVFFHEGSFENSRVLEMLNNTEEEAGYVAH